MRKLPEVVEFYRKSDDIDYMPDLQVADIAAFDRIYQTLIRSGDCRT